MQSRKILVVEDYEEFRRFIVSVLQRRADYEVVGKASDGLEAVQLGEHLENDDYPENTTPERLTTMKFCSSLMTQFSSKPRLISLLPH